MITQATTANLDLGHSREILNAAYRQVFGNKHLMELDILPSVNALYINGDLTVQGLITALAQSETYRRLFLETNNPYRFVELNFKHLLGRAPRDQSEVMEHVRLMADKGFEAEITSSWDLSDGPFFVFNGGTVPAFTNGVAGASGLIRVTSAISGWTGNVVPLDVTLPSPTAFPSIIPYYVSDSSTVLLGSAQFAG